MTKYYVYEDGVKMDEVSFLVPLHYEARKRYVQEYANKVEINPHLVSLIQVSGVPHE